MATWKDFRNVYKTKGPGELIKQLATEISEDQITTWGSALAYAWIFAIFPMLIVLLSLTPYLPFDTKTKAMTELSNLITRGIGGDTAKVVVDNLNDVMSHTQGGLLSIGLLLALWAASGGVSNTISALTRAYGVEKDRPFIKHRLLALGLTIAMTLILLTVLTLTIAGGVFTDWLAQQGAIGGLSWVLLHLLRYAILLGGLFLAVATIYYFGPNIKQKWRTITPGAIFTIIIWILTSVGFSYYVSHFGNFNKTYGTLGAAIILLMFFFINSMVLLVGAEINSLLDREILHIPLGEADFSKAWPTGSLQAQSSEFPAPADKDNARAQKPQRKRQWSAIVLSGAAVVTLSGGLALLWKKKHS